MDKETWYKKIEKSKTIDKFNFIIEFCKDKNVLDVGCIGQDKSYTSEEWLHGRIKKSAKELIGADIMKEEVVKLNELNFSIYLPEELLTLNKKFDVIVMGDVIEHVNDPGQFLSFYSQFLTENGRMIICTPNSFGVRYFIQVLIYGRPGTNEEHTLAFDPLVILELFKRIRLEPTDFHWLKEYHRGSNWKQKFILICSRFLILFRAYFNSNFMFIVKNEK